MVLDRMYSYKYCSPSRSSFLSGRLPIHVTQNNRNNLVENPGGADLRMSLLPQKLAAFNYYNAIVGKWHVGARSAENLPINRGFDSHFGFLKGGEDHINQHSSDDNLVFVDLWRDRAPAYGENGTFSTIMYAERPKESSASMPPRGKTGRCSCTWRGRQHTHLSRPRPHSRQSLCPMTRKRKAVRA